MQLDWSILFERSKTGADLSEPSRQFKVEVKLQFINSMTDIDRIESLILEWGITLFRGQSGDSTATQMKKIIFKFYTKMLHVSARRQVTAALSIPQL